MRWFWLLLCLLPVACAPPPVAEVPPAAEASSTARPELSGTVTGVRILRGELELAGDLRVPAGSRLLIEPGTTIWVRPSESTKIDPEYLSAQTEILVQGELEIRGSESEPVRFRALPSADPVEPGDPLWAGIELIGGRAHLEHLELERAETGVLVQGGTAEVNAARLVTCRTGLAVQAGGHLTLAKSSLNGGETGLFCWAGSSLNLSDSLIADQDEEGLYLANGCSSTLSDTLLRHNDRGLVAPGEVAGLRFEDNRRDVLPLANGDLP